MKVQFKFAGFKAQVVGKNKQAEANAAPQPAQGFTQLEYSSYPNGPVPGAMIEVGELSGTVELSLEELVQVHTTKRELLAFVTEKWKIPEFAETIVMALGTKLDQNLATERDRNDAREAREQELHEAQLANTRAAGKTERPICEQCGGSSTPHNPGTRGTCHATYEHDTTRLDFMVRTGAVVQWYGETCQLHGSAGAICGADEFYESAREAIDAAMTLEQQ